MIPPPLLSYLDQVLKEGVVFRGVNLDHELRVLLIIPRRDRVLVDARVFDGPPLAVVFNSVLQGR